MSSLHLTIITLLGLYFTGLNDAEKKGVVWKQVGEDITIQCRGSNDYEFLSLFQGLNKTVRLLFTEKSKKVLFGEEIKERSQTNGDFPNVDILIKNLTLNDIGPYYCEYKKIGEKGNQKIINGQGSVLLVVTGEPHQGNKQECGPSDQSLVIVSVVIAGTVLLVIVAALFIWITLKFQTRSKSATRKSKHNVTNDVYEDMRGTLRR
ncbi:uncharacterized protein si:ch211-188c18.1 [Melanotaenia boesemani]|uniref:uncharacterized protein si:ch211-188c18.1 n=1 Tax=Melanotaenia boesemani TaxID=1250792 RepID=UPI001C03FEA2|nr:uncharacterized protein si:ch211-188c18.1 [Melanotaenia boesemani]